MNCRGNSRIVRAVFNMVPHGCLMRQKNPREKKTCIKCKDLVCEVRRHTHTGGRKNTTLKRLTQNLTNLISTYYRYCDLSEFIKVLLISVLHNINYKYR